MKHLIKLTVLAAAFAVAGPATAGESYLDLRLHNADLDIEVGGGTASDDGTGLDIRGGFAASPNVTIIGRLSQVELDDSNVDLSRFEIGAQLEASQSGSVIPFGSLSLGNVELDDASGSVDDDGIILRGGLRFVGNAAIQADATIGFVMFDDIDGIELAGTITGKVTDRVSALLGLAIANLEDDANAEFDLTELTFGARIHF